MPRIAEHHAGTLAEAAAAVAETVATRLRAAIAERGRASCAVSGGRTPLSVFPALQTADVPWERVSLTLTDDRWVPADHPDSTEGLVRALLLTGPAARASFLPLYTGDPTPDAGHAETERRLATFPLPLDTVFFGLGADGHIASLFPNGPEMIAGGLSVASFSPSAPFDRISLTVSTLLTARHATLIVNGPAKRAIYDQARAEPLPEDLRQAIPVALLLHHRTLPLSIFMCP